MTTASELIADATGCRVDAVPGDARIGEFALWDSLAHMALVAAIEQHIGRSLSTDEILSIDSVKSIDALLREAG